MSFTAHPLRIVLVVVAVVALSACSADPGPTTAPAESGDGPTTTGPAPAVVAERLDAPWSVAFHGDTPLISERDTARIIELGDGEPREVGAVGGVTSIGEGGLLGIAVHEGLLYAYSTGAGQNRIQRFELTGTPGSLGLGEGTTILDGIPSASFHNGGRIAFGPDGMLYATTGDAGATALAQNLDSLAGKILRMTPDGAVPDDNPFEGSHVYSYGHRNPQGIAWTADGTMFASEFGQNTWDELNVIEAGGNYGWPEVEGIAGNDDYVDPVQQWRPSEASPSGMTVAGDSIYVANLRGERLRRIPLSDPATSAELMVGEYGRLRDVVLTPEGGLWVLTNNTDGRGVPGPGDDRLLEFSPVP
jgi:glucose/arabinose dehydrogenase